MSLGRVLALDIGDRRVGLALSDPLGISARPHTTLDREALGDEGLFDVIAELIEDASITDILAGDPVLPSGDRGEQCQRVDAFLEELQAHLAQRLGARAPRALRQEESLTSVRAAERLAARGIDARSARRSGLLDAEAAALLLEEWLAARHGSRLPPP